MAWKRCETWSTDHQYFIFHDTKLELFIFFEWFSLAAAVHVKCVRLEARFLSCPKPCSFLSGKSELLPRKVSKSCKFINVMTDYYHSQQPSAARQDKVLITSLTRLEAPTPSEHLRLQNDVIFKIVFPGNLLSVLYSRRERLHKGLSHETKSTFKFLADLEAHCAEAKTNKTWENSLVVPSCDVLCHCLPHT